MSNVTFLIKRCSYKKNQHQIDRRVLISLLYHYSIYKSVSTPNQSFYKYDFLKNINDHLAA